MLFCIPCRRAFRRAPAPRVRYSPHIVAQQPTALNTPNPAHVVAEPPITLQLPDPAHMVAADTRNGMYDSFSSMQTIPLATIVPHASAVTQPLGVQDTRRSHGSDTSSCGGAVMNLSSPEDELVARLSLVDIASPGNTTASQPNNVAELELTLDSFSSLQHANRRSPSASSPFPVFDQFDYPQMPASFQTEHYAGKVQFVQGQRLDLAGEVTPEELNKRLMSLVDRLEEDAWMYN